MKSHTGIISVTDQPETYQEPKKCHCLVLGVTGNLGTLLYSIWQDKTPALFNPIYQHRREKFLGENSLHCNFLKSFDSLRLYITKNGPIDVIINLSGITSGSIDNLNLNVALGEATLQMAIEFNIPRVIIASSSAVYGVNDGTPFLENNMPKPINYYGLSKLQMEKRCKDYHAKGLDICIIRVGNVVGADAFTRNLFKSTKKNPVIIQQLNDGSDIMRSYIGIETLAQVLYSLSTATDLLPFILNVAAPIPNSMKALAIESKLPWKLNKSLAEKTYNVILDCSLLSKLYCFSLEDSNPTIMIHQLKRITKFNSEIQ